MRTKEEILILSEYLTKRETNFSCAGLFSIDYSMIYMALGLVISNMVVVLQFK
uniref:Gustatory receptor n=1 Tax=Anoplophora chinensis TaxID=217632 RepID=A0A2H4ZBC5_ANOCN|nr:gustatory receptor [Anoplophora chinensis]